jgi:nucleoside-diphosphate-sugar epimerase
MKTLLVTGITGLTGRFLYEHINQNHPDLVVRYFVRPDSDISWMRKSPDIFRGNLNNVDDIRKSLHGIDTILHLAPRHALKKILSTLDNKQVKRIFFISSTSVYSQFKAPDHIDITNEEELRRSGIDYTIIRPAMIYGNDQDKSIHILVKILNRFPVFPIIGNGQSLMQPIYADDVAKAISSALSHEQQCRNKEYDIAGYESMTYKQLLKVISNALGKKTVFIHIPTFIAMFLAKVLSYTSHRFLTTEKVDRLSEDKAFDYSKAATDLGFTPIPFEQGINKVIVDLKNKQII